MPKVVLGGRSVFKYAGGISPGFAAAFGSRFRKPARNNSRIQGKIPVTLNAAFIFSIA